MWLNIRFGAVLLAAVSAMIVSSVVGEVGDAMARSNPGQDGKLPVAITKAHRWIGPAYPAVGNGIRHGLDATRFEWFAPASR
jgi:hypothetical protein